MSLSPAIEERVAVLLGRQPRGLEEVAVYNDHGDPSVIRVAPLVDGKPFPTMFWLVDKALNYRIDQEEAGGLIHSLQQKIDSSPELQQRMVEDHRAYMSLRQRYLTDNQRQALERGGFANVFERKGIGGIANFSRIRCLHTWYAAHLVTANTVGRLLDEYWLESP